VIPETWYKFIDSSGSNPASAYNSFNPEIVSSHVKLHDLEWIRWVSGSFRDFFRLTKTPSLMKSITDNHKSII